MRGLFTQMGLLALARARGCGVAFFAAGLSGVIRTLSVALMEVSPTAGKNPFLVLGASLEAGVVYPFRRFFSIGLLCRMAAQYFGILLLPRQCEVGHDLGRPRPCFVADSSSHGIVMQKPD